jgi:hypothetical protein
MILNWTNRDIVTLRAATAPLSATSLLAYSSTLPAGEKAPALTGNCSSAPQHRQLQRRRIYGKSAWILKMAGFGVWLCVVILD